MKVSFIIPVFNEENTIEKVLDRVLSLSVDKEVIAVNDGSADKTREMLNNYVDKITIINLEENIGRGGAILKGLEIAKADAVAFLDADLEVDPAEYINLIEHVVSDNCPVAWGSRFLSASYCKMSILQRYGNRLLTFITNLLYGVKMTDIQSGTMVFQSQVIKKLRLVSKGWDLSIETASKLLQNKIKIKEIPIEYTPRPNRMGKKLNWKDGFTALYYIFKYRFRENGL